MPVYFFLQPSKKTTFKILDVCFFKKKLNYTKAKSLLKVFRVPGGGLQQRERTRLLTSSAMLPSFSFLMH